MYLAILFHFHKSFQILPTSIPNQLKVFYIKKSQNLKQLTQKTKKTK